MRRNVKMVGTYLLWDLYMWLIVLGENFLYKFFNQLANRNYEMKYTYLMMCSTIMMCTLLGLGLAYLFNKKEVLSRKDLILELCIVGCPAFVFSVCAIPSGVQAIVGVQILILKNMRLAFEVGGIIIGIEIFKITSFARRKKAV